jgi:hypothetical protein
MKQETDSTEEIGKNELMARFLYSPYHFNAKKQQVKPEAFRPPYEIDEVSVTRFMIAGEEFCTNLAIKAQRLDIDPPKKYEGLGLISHEKILKSGAHLRSTPILDKNPFHADIYFNTVLVKNEILPGWIREIWKYLADASQFMANKQQL